MGKISPNVLKRHNELKKQGTISEFHYDQKIYYDGRQFSVKLPKEMMNFFEHKQGDTLRFIVDISEKGEPKLKVEYIKTK